MTASSPAPLRSSWSSALHDPAFFGWRDVLPYVEAAGVRIGLGNLSDARGFLDHGPALLFGSADPGAATRTLAIGAEPWWTISGWHERIERHASIRRQLARGSRKGVTIEEVNVLGTEAARAVHLAATWRRETLGFVLRLDPLILFAPRRLFLAKAGGEVVALTLLSPIPGRDAWLTERFARSPNAPNGTMATMFNAAVRAVEQDGARGFTMGLSPFEGEASSTLQTLAGWRFGGAIDFAGLRAFKAKFDPERWEPRYLVRSANLLWLSAGRALDAAFHAL